MMQRQMPQPQLRFIDRIADDFSSVVRKGSNYQDCEELCSINRQRPDIAGGANVNEDELDVKACNQGIVFGYTTDETVNTALLTHLITSRLGKRMTDFPMITQRQDAAGAVELPQTLLIDSVEDTPVVQQSSLPTVHTAQKTEEILRVRLFEQGQATSKVPQSFS